MRYNILIRSSIYPLNKLIVLKNLDIVKFGTSVRIKLFVMLLHLGYKLFKLLGVTIPRIIWHLLQSDSIIITLDFRFSLLDRLRFGYRAYVWSKNFLVCLFSGKRLLFLGKGRSSSTMIHRIVERMRLRSSFTKSLL